ncbi:hypothetical protein ABRY94_11990 [Castellaniella ginsengisoli]|uniref:ZZ-type domain-containing protein n=1 Tax=Castellaniella ginsengisoli TaxID=546114 RepID=A0AB39EN23_9BURK
MNACTRCGSFAINPAWHGRDDSDLDLCDVCYWRGRAERRLSILLDISMIRPGHPGCGDLSREQRVWADFEAEIQRAAKGE